MGGLIQRLGIDLSEAAVAPEASLQLPAGGVGDAANVSDAGGSSGAEGASVAFGAEQSLNTSDSNKIRDGKLSTTGNIAAGVSTFVVAYAIHKVFAPLRVGITLSVVPFVVRYYRRTWKKR
ncbi:protein of unknown function DUF1279 [Trinorchestia longiramus]|nr:protein of unknown function DUF1279 [Trinorchestia longiramus]